MSGNRRYYSEKDINYLKLIHSLLKNKGLTINGAKKALRDPALKLDGTLFSSVNNKNLKQSVKLRAEKIQRIIKKKEKN